MTEAAPPAPGGPVGLRGWAHRLIARPGFQAWASRFPLTRRHARKDGAALFDLVQGFVQSQALLALVELRLLHRLMQGPQSIETLARQMDLPDDRMAVLLQAGAAMGLLRRRRDGRFDLARRGAAVLGVPGLEAMILHHRALYRDLEDPVGLLRSDGQTELAAFWPYVFGAEGARDPETVSRYSNLMAESQAMVAQDTLAQISLDGAQHLMDIGGGTGAFVTQAARHDPSLRLSLFDLPGVEPAATQALARAGLADRVRFCAGSFRDDPLPRQADMISLVRVLYDHRDDTVRQLLTDVFCALPPGGRLLISEPMSGGAHPDPVTDVYFAFYTMAMGSGRTRSAQAIAEFCRDAGFEQIRTPRPKRPYVTSVVTAVKPE